MVFEKIAERDLSTGFISVALDPAYKAISIVGRGLTNIVQDVAGSDPFKGDRTSGWQQWKAIFELLIKTVRGLTEQGTEPRFEAKVLMSLSNEIQYRKTFFVIMQSQTAPQLLEEHCQTFSRAQKKNGVNFRNVDTFVVEVNYKDGTSLMKSCSATSQRS
jgi:hypothetical protein